MRLSDDLYIATVGGEPCYGVEKAVVSAFGGKEIFFIGYTDSCAYIVDDVLLDEGGYEPTCENISAKFGRRKQKFLPPFRRPADDTPTGDVEFFSI
ncbi:MAG: hypothetical protein IKU65_00790 [Oscillospiraceae bacterium]|nr:hypothetical protein [Oscillospiraceae bacterium]